MKPVYIIDAVRTPIAKYAGALSTIRPDDLLAETIKALIRRNINIDIHAIEDVIAGCANQAGEDNRDIARMSALLAGLPITVGGNTVNRLCASGLQAIMDASRAIRCSDGDMILAGGVESMSRAPYVMGKADVPFSRSTQLFDTTIGWRFINPALSALHHPYSMGETAENIAIQWNISREAQDEFAHGSQLKYTQAQAVQRFKDEIIAIEITEGKDKKTFFDTDEHPRLSSIDKLAALKPAFKKEGTVTAGNSSGVNDGASMLLLASEEAVKKYNAAPIAMIKSMAIAGVEPRIMGIGPVPATQKALLRAGLKIQDIDLVELNEAFASQALACIRDLDLNPQQVNVNGGAIALGHPLGASGARISTTLLYELKRQQKKYGLATMCIGVGQGAAVVYERV